MQKKGILVLGLILTIKISFAQFFEGEIDYTSYFLHKETMKLLFDPISEIVTIKGGKYKIFLPAAEKGQLEWQIDNFYNGLSFSRKSYKNADRIVTDKDPTFTKDGQLTFQKPDSVLVAPILKRSLCGQINDTADTYKKLDTTIIINGLKCNVITAIRNNRSVNEYYYCDTIKLDPIQYKCNRLDRLDKLYKLTNGSLIVQLVTFDDLYTVIYQVQSITPKIIDEKTFEIPPGIKIQNAN